jgi:uncharacterized phage protein (TIGR02218 family)
MTKASTGTLPAYLAGIRGTDAVLYMADCFTWNALDGQQWFFTNLEQSVVFNGNTYLGNSILISGLKYKASLGVNVDSQTIKIAARPTDNAAPGGYSFLVALRSTLFDGCQIQRDRVFFSGGFNGSQIGSVTLFKGRLSTIKSVGRTSAQITVKSDLVLLDIQMPRNLWQATCMHTLYDAGCTLNKATFATAGSVGAGSTTTTINFGAALATMAQGRIIFTSGANDGLSATMGTAVAGVSVSLRYPLPVAPSPGDTFTAYLGCDHTEATCQSVFDNFVNFRGFPFVPPPEISL